MKEVIVLFLVSNTIFSSAVFIKQKLKRNSRSDSLDAGITIESSHFLQKLDHFSPENDQKWDQRYWFSGSYYKPGGPAFLLIDGEWVADGQNDFTESWASYGKELGALLYSLEHRFYGESWPNNKSMVYLSTAQAQADIANFIEFATEKYQMPKDTKWIVFGCSYAGTLAAWTRFTYPHLVRGAVASSAPMVAKVDIYDYFENVGNSLKSYDPKCLESIAQVIEEMASFLNDTENLKNISRIFHFRDDQEQDIVNVVKSLFYDMTDILSSAVQYDYDSSTFNIRTVCDTMINHNGTKLEAFEELRQMDLDQDDDDDSIHRWSYQCCSEFGFFCNFTKTPFLSALSHLHPIENQIKEQCGEFFGPNFGIEELNEKINSVNLRYGGLDFNIGNTLFVHGSVDPWHTSGIYEKKSGSLYDTIFINGTSHCADVYRPSSTDIPELKQARRETFEIIKKWLET